MNCEQVRRTLNSPEPIDSNPIRAHIAQCRPCARAHEAERLLRASLRAVRTNPSDTEAATISARATIERVIATQGESQMPEILKHPFTTPKRRWGWSLAAAATLLLVGVLIPFSYNHTIGTRLVLDGDLAGVTLADLAAINSRLAKAGFDGARVEHENGALVYLVPGNRDRALDAFTATQDALPALTTGLGVRLEPWVVRETGSLLAQIGSRFEITIESAGKTEQEIADEIRNQLQMHGASVRNVTVQRSPDGETTINIDGVTAPPGTLGGGGEAQIELKTKGDGALSTQLFFEAPDPNLSDAEKIEAIKQQLAAQGITNADVKIKDGEITIEAMKQK